jgi:integrase
MTARRARGEGTLFYDQARQRWTVSLDIGFSPMGKRRRIKASARTKTEAKALLLKMRRDASDGLPPEQRGYTVGEAVESWLQYGLTRRDENTRKNRRILAYKHVIPALGARRLTELTAEDIDGWLADRAKTLSTDSLNRLLSILRSSIRRAQARELVRRNVALLCEVPRGTGGRPSKSLTLDQAQALLAAAEGTPMNAYIVLSLLTGARTEELRALTWDHLDLDADPPTIMVWRSVRRGGETKTPRSRRTLELPNRCTAALRAHRRQQAEAQLKAGTDWIQLGLVFCTQYGTALDAANVRRSFRRVVAASGLDPHLWTPRELRQSFVSLLSSSGLPIEDISHLVGHASTRVTELVYRKELRPALTKGARAMDAIIDGPAEGSGSP